jgi:transglutaminase-like putative cysteine protease
MIGRIAFVTLLGLLVAAGADAQPEMKWGDIPDELLDMTEYPADPDAAAVIVGDIGEATVSSRWDVRFERHRRIKILSEAGYDLGTVSLVYVDEDGLERVSAIKGQTFVREPDGRVRRVKLDKGSIFHEDLPGGRKRVTFTLPALAPGAVVEFQYRIDAESPFFIPRWYFQDEEPTLYSAFEVESPGTLAYTFITQGNPDFVERSEERGVRTDGKTSHRRWAVASVPALREERYMTTLEDYVQKIDAQLVQYYRSGHGAVDVVKTWPQLAKELEDDVSFGRRLRVNNRVKEQTAALTAGLTSNEDKARALYDFVRTSVVWDGRRTAFAERELADVMASKRGTAAEINLLLTAMLREAGLPAQPALLSTRDHGSVLRIYPLLTQFNSTVAAYKQGGRWHLLDATDPLRPMEMLPFESLGGEAWLASDNDWVSTRTATGEHAVRIEAALSPDGTLSGTLRSERHGYSALRARQQVQELGAEVYAAEHLVDEIAGVETHSVTVSGQDDDTQPLVTELAFAMPGYGQAVGDLMLLNPLLVMRTDENPFKLPSRSYPVDFGYPFRATYEAEITMPEGYVVDEVPQAALLLLPVRAGGYERRVEVEDGVLRVEAETQFNRSVFEPNLYDGLKSFYDKSVAADAETVVLTRAEADAAAPSAAAPAPVPSTEGSNE